MKFSLKNGDGVTVVGPHLDLADKNASKNNAFLNNVILISERSVNKDD